MPLTSRQMLSIRKALDLKQEGMARLLGVSFVSVNRWEKGHSAPYAGIVDIYRAIGAALQAGSSPEAIVEAAYATREEFLLRLFTMAYGKKRSAG